MHDISRVHEEEEARKAQRGTFGERRVMAVWLFVPRQILGEKPFSADSSRLAVLMG